MNVNDMVTSSIVGQGIVIGARELWNAIPLGTATRFVDDCDLATLRAHHPEWQDVSLSPIDLTDETGALGGLADGAFDHVWDWRYWAADDASMRNTAIARVLRPGGMLVLAALDSRFALDRTAGEAACRTSHEALPFASFVGKVAKVSASAETRFELDHLTRYGRFNLAFLRRNVSRIAEGMIVVCDGRYLACEPPFLRYISSPAALTQLRMAGRRTAEITGREQAAFLTGRPIAVQDVPAFLARTDALS